MTDLRVAVSAMLDTPGVHPGNDDWYTAYDQFFTQVKETTVEEAIHGSLDYLNVHDDATQLQARVNFWNAFNESRRPVRERLKKTSKNVGKAVRTAGSKVKEAATAAPKSQS